MVIYSMRVEWSEPDGMYVAICPELGGLSALGSSYEDAVRELQVAIDLAVATYREDGKPLPRPRVPERHSGQFRLRLPKSLHASLARWAEDEGVSLNTLVTSILAESQGYAIGGRTATESISSRIAELYSYLTSYSARQVKYDPTSSWTSLKDRAFESAELHSDSVDAVFHRLSKEE